VLPHRIQRLGGAVRKGQLVNGVRVWHTDVLYRGVFLDPFDTTFAAHTGMLDATHWCSGICNDAGNDADEAKFDLLSHTLFSVMILRLHTHRHSVWGCVS